MTKIIAAAALSAAMASAFLSNANAAPRPDPAKCAIRYVTRDGGYDPAVDRLRGKVCVVFVNVRDQRN